MAELPEARQEPDLTALVREVIAGDGPAGEKLATLSYEKAYRYAVRGVRDDDTARDIAQNVMLRVFTGLRDLRTPEIYMIWLMCITRNEVLKHKRDLKYHATYFEPMSETEDIELVADGGPSPLDSLIASDRRALVRSTLEKMRPADREMLELYAYQNLSVGEIAHVLGISSTNAAVRMQRACARFRAIVKSEVGLYEEA